MMPYLCVKINIGVRVIEEVLKYAEISRSYAECTGRSHANHAPQRMNLTNILEDIINQAFLTLEE